MTPREQAREIIRQIIEKHAPDKVLLFGSRAKGALRKGSDIDLCIVKDTEDVRGFKRDVQLSLDTDIPVDLVVYTPAAWAELTRDSSSFAYQIHARGAAAVVDSTRYLDWLRMAKNDLEAARILFEHGADNALVCFHCQQAIEKYLKGYILKHTQQIVEGHSLVRLCKTAGQSNPGFGNHLKDLSLVNEYYIETRYPADQPLSISRDDVLECLGITERIMAFIDANL